MSVTVSPDRDQLQPPSHLRPSASRHHSSASILSDASVNARRPHAQHREFIPVIDVVGGEGVLADGIGDAWKFDEVAEEAEALEEVVNPSPNPAPAESHHEEWDNMRDGSISRRSAWRRPSPNWIYPIVAGMALAMGMAMAPRSELYISLACLSHPPQQHSAHEIMLLSSAPDIWTHHAGIWRSDDHSLSLNASLPVKPLPRQISRSPADAWFIKAQHDFYEFQMPHLLTKTSPSSPAHTTSRETPSAPLPHPTVPNDGSWNPNDSAPVSEKPMPDTGRQANAPPYHQIDPSLCKKDPQVQAAAARLTMSGCG